MDEPTALFTSSPSKEDINKAMKKFYTSLGFRSYLKFNLNFLDFEAKNVQNNQVFG